MRIGLETRNCLPLPATFRKTRCMGHGGQVKKLMGPESAKGRELVIPNPRLKLMDSAREVLLLAMVVGEYRASNQQE